MTHQPDNDPKATINTLQEQFRDLCVIGMRGAEAIANFRDDPTEKLRVVKESTAKINEGLTELKQETMRSIRFLSDGEEIFWWEYEALEKIASDAEILFEEIQDRITIQNGRVMELNLSFTSAANLTSIADLTALNELDLGSTQVSDLSPLANLTALESLSLWDTQVVDLSPLAQLIKIKKLQLGDTRIANLNPLVNLGTLRTLYLWDTQVTDLSPLTGLTTLQTLALDGTKIADLSHLSNLPELEALHLDGTPVSVLSPIAELPMLSQVWLRHTPALTDPASQTIIRKLESKGVTTYKE